MRTLTGIAAIGYLKNVVLALQKEYNESERAIEIIEIDGKYTMRVKNAYIERVKQFAQESELSKSALRTLAFISKHDGVLKSELAKRIGPQIYNDVKELINSGFVKPQKAGRSAKLFLTEKFKKYFNQQ
jgi:segregation and condensation protein B